MKKIIGYLLMSSPFIFVTALMVSKGGWQSALTVWGIVLIIIALIVVGVKLTDS